MKKKKENKMLHNLDRIATTLKLLQCEFDKLYEDLIEKERGEEDDISN